MEIVQTCVPLRPDNSMGPSRALRDRPSLPGVWLGRDTSLRLAGQLSHRGAPQISRPLGRNAGVNSVD